MNRKWDKINIKFKIKFSLQTANFSQFSQRIKQYIAAKKNHDLNNDSDLNEAFNAMIISINNENIESTSKFQIN